MRISCCRFTAASLGLLGVAMLSLVALAQESDLQKFRQLQSDLNERMEKDLDAAATYLDGLIEKDPDSEDLNVLRHSLATKFVREEEYDVANEQFQKLLEFQIAHIEQAQNQYGIWQTIQSMQDIAADSNDGKALRIAVELGYDALSKAGAQTLIPISRLAVIKAQFMIDDEKDGDAKELVKTELAKLKKVNGSEKASEQSMRALVGMLGALTTSDRGNDEWRDDYVKELDHVTTAAFEQFPKSRLLQTQFAETQYLMISRWGQDDPKATKERIESVTKKLSPIAMRNRSVEATLRRIELHREKMAAAKPVSSLVGKPAPEWDIDAWVNVITMDRDELKGKVVLLDFWAMWCGPCIATFPHLREWREEFGDDGFEIVGVTKYYNFEWDDEAKRASRAKGDVSPEEERGTLASFLEHHKLEHPVIVTPEGSKMSSLYGVKGIPHVVLIDRDGVVQLIKTGAGEATAKEIHAKIKELMNPKKEEAEKNAAEKEETGKKEAE